MTLAVVLVVSALIAGIDQLIKYFIVQDLAPVGQVSVIDNLFSLYYVENRGAAFGIFQDRVLIFAIITGAMIGVFIYLIAKKKLTGKLFLVSTMLIIGGGVGNLIDRIFRGFVVDYLAVSFFPPVCNFADYCIVIGAVLFIVSMLIQDKKDGRKKLSNEGNTNEHQ